MHLSLEELFGSDEWFGSRNVLFVGDILQLPPVNGNPVFEKIDQKSLVSRLGCTTAVNIWQESVPYDELNINERQKKDPEYSSILNNVRLGISSDETLSVLQQRLRDTYRKDLPLYFLPIDKSSTKRRLTGVPQCDLCQAEKLQSSPPLPRKRQQTLKSKPSKKKSCKDRKRPATDHMEADPSAKKLSNSNDFNTGQLQVWPFKFYSVNEQWQRDACATLGVDFRQSNRLRPGGPDVPLRHPNLHTIRPYSGRW